MTYQLTALTAVVGSDQIEVPGTVFPVWVLPWVLFSVTVSGMVVVLIGVGARLYGLRRSSMGLNDDAITHGKAIMIAGSLIGFSAGVIGLVTRPGTDTAVDRTDDTAATPEVTTTTSVPATPIDWTPVLIVAGSIVLVLALLAAAVFAIVRTRSHLTDRAAADKTRRTDFAVADAIYTDVADQYAAYLADPDAIFTRPLLDDTSDTLTAAFADAGAIRPDTCPTETARIETFRTAAQSARRAWHAADTHARKVGMGPRTDDETRTLRRIRDALALALDDAATPGERENALAAVHRLSEGLITVPERVTATVRRQLTGSTRKQLTV